MINKIITLIKNLIFGNKTTNIKQKNKAKIFEETIQRNIFMEEKYKDAVLINLLQQHYYGKVKSKQYTNEATYYLYDSSQHLESNLHIIYKKTIVDRLWIEEPFHSKFFEILVFFSINNFMILDPNSRVITMHIRDKNNKEQETKTYQVLSSNDILSCCFKKISYADVNYSKEDFQIALVALLIIVLKMSKLNGISINANDMLVNYIYKDKVHEKVKLINSNHSSFSYFNEILKDAIRCSTSYPYNDIENHENLLLPIHLPKKTLREC